MIFRHPASDDVFSVIIRTTDNNTCKVSCGNNGKIRNGDSNFLSFGIGKYFIRTGECETICTYIDHMTVVGFLVVFKRNGTGIADGHTGVFSAVHNGRIGLRSILRNKCNKEFIIYAFYNFTFGNKTGSTIFFAGIGHNGYLHARQNVLDSHETSGTKFFHQLSDYTFDIVYIL